MNNINRETLLSALKAKDNGTGTFKRKDIIETHKESGVKLAT